MKHSNTLYCIIAAGIAIAALFIGSTGLTAREIDLNDCIRFALENNPGLASQVHGADASKELINKQKSNLWPLVYGRASYSRFSSDVSAGPLDQDYGFSVNLRQSIYNGGAFQAGINNARAMWQASRYDVEIKRLDLILEVTTAYYRLLESTRVLRVAVEFETQAQTNLEAAKERLRLGIARKADSLKAEVEVSDARLRVIAARHTLKRAESELITIMGMPVNHNIRIEDDLDTAREDLNTVLPEDEKLIEQADTNLPELKVLDMTIRAGEAALKIAKSKYLPSLGLIASYNWNGTAIPRLENRWDLGFSLEIPIFSGFSKRAGINYEQARIRMLNKQKEQLDRDLILAVQIEVLNVKEAAEGITNSRRHLKNASENMAIASGEYNEGVGSMLELIDARTIYVEAEQRVISALAQYRISLARLSRRIGRHRLMSDTPTNSDNWRKK